MLDGWRGIDAGFGVIQLDEIDKVAVDTGVVEGVSKSAYLKRMAHFLPLLGREPMPVSSGRVIQTSAFTVLATGAFSEHAWSAAGIPPTTEQLIRAGLTAELAGRLEFRLALPPHTAQTLAALYRRQFRGEFGAVRGLAYDLGFRLRIARETYAYTADAAASRGASSREGRGWLEAACHAAISRALEERRRPGVLVVSPDDVRLPPTPEQPRSGGDDTWGSSAWV